MTRSTAPTTIADYREAYREEQVSDPCPIHTWFSLSRASYFVLPRLAMQSMPAGWQERFIALMDEANAAGVETPTYHVLREGGEFSRAVLEDEEDEYGPIDRYDVRRPDPWADYRHGDIKALCPEFSTDRLRAEKLKREAER